LRKFFDPSPSLVTPADLVRAITGRKAKDLALPRRAVITFDNGGLRRLLQLRASPATPLKAWSRFRTIYKIEGTETVITRCCFGGPNVATLVEELSAFGVGEIILWGYCGGIGESTRMGSVILVEAGLREEGVSYHYMKTSDPLVPSNWYNPWRKSAATRDFLVGRIWSCDAIYRETAGKVEKVAKVGIVGVEMEVASFYAVCRFLGVKGVAFLVVSDLLRDGKWTPGFFGKECKSGTEKIVRFIAEEGVV
jgi:uridine phosphorylase